MFLQHGCRLILGAMRDTCYSNRGHASENYDILCLRREGQASIIQSSVGHLDFPWIRRDSALQNSRRSEIDITSSTHEKPLQNIPAVIGKSDDQLVHDRPLTAPTGRLLENIGDGSVTHLSLISIPFSSKTNHPVSNFRGQRSNKCCSVGPDGLLYSSVVPSVTEDVGTFMTTYRFVELILESTSAVRI